METTTGFVWKDPIQEEGRIFMIPNWSDLSNQVEFPLYLFYSPAENPVISVPTIRASVLP